MARPRGRPAATRGVFAIEDPALLLPERIALDTSLVVRALIETQLLHEACSGFLERIVASEVTLVSSELLEAELAEAAFGIAVAERWGAAWRRHRRDGRARRRARRLLSDVQSRYALLLASVDHVAVPIAPIAEDAWDDLEVLRTTEDRIEGQAWHAPDDRMMGFSVDVRTGEHEGGAYEDVEPSESD